MEQALDSSGKLIQAEIALPGNYWCRECREKAHLRGGFGCFMRPHFYHYRYNPMCGECIGEHFDGTGARYPKPEKCVHYLESQNYKDRWNESIEGLYVHGNLEWLYRKDYAISPIRNYLENGRFRRDEGMLKALAMVAFSYTRLDIADVVLQLHDWSFDWSSEKERIKLSCWLFDRFLESEIQGWIRVLDECGVSYPQFVGQIVKCANLLGTKRKQGQLFWDKIKTNASAEAEGDLARLKSLFVRNGLIAPS